MPEAPLGPPPQTGAPPPTGLRALAVVRGWPAARATLADWSRRPIAVLAPWIAIALCIALVLLGLVWLVGATSPADPTRLNLRRLLTVHQEWRIEAWHLFRNNLLVLALHAMACLAGFIVHLALTDPVEGEHPRIAAWSRSLAIVAVAFVPIATILSIGTQSWVLGARAATLADQLRLPVPTVLWTTTTHSLPELAAVFLPLAASMYLIAIGRPDQLLAATLATVVVAVPVIAVSAVLETRVWPKRLVAARDANPHFENTLIGTAVVDPTDHFSATARLSAGRQIDDIVHGDRAAAVSAAGQHDGAAVAVLRGRDGFVLHELIAARTPQFCHRLSGMRVVWEAMSIDELARLKRDPSTPFVPALEAFVEGSRVIGRSDLEAPPVTRTFKHDC